MSGFEIERKFLVHKDKDYKSRAYAYSYIKQGYIAARNATVRVRVRDDRAYLTIKGPSVDGGLKRYEFEKEITIEEAQHLFELCEPGVVEKTRYLVRSGDHIIEVDEFVGDNEGLVIAEVELGAPDEPYDRPPFLGEEVTGDHRYTNASLSKVPYCQWSEKGSEGGVKGE